MFRSVGRVQVVQERTAMGAQRLRKKKVSMIVTRTLYDTFPFDTFAPRSVLVVRGGFLSFFFLSIGFRFRGRCERHSRTKPLAGGGNNPSEVMCCRSQKESAKGRKASGPCVCVCARSGYDLHNPNFVIISST